MLYVIVPHRAGHQLGGVGIVVPVGHRGVPGERCQKVQDGDQPFAAGPVVAYLIVQPLEPFASTVGLRRLVRGKKCVPHERAVIQKNNLAVVYLTHGEERLPYLLLMLLKKWNEMEILESTTPRPFARFVNIRGQIKNTHRGLHLP